MFVQLTREYLGKPPGERIDLAEPDARALIDAGLAAAVSDDALAPAVARALEGAMSKLGGALTGAVEKALHQFGDAQRRCRKNAAPLLFGEGGGDPHGRTFGDWLLCVRRNDVRTLEEKYGSRLVGWDNAEGKAAMNTTSGVQGGYTVPAEFLPRLMRLASETSVVRPRATVVPMSSRSLHVPCLDHTTAPSAGDTAMFGGLTARWTEEAAAITETEPQFKQIELVAHELSGYSKISNALLADNAAGLEALLVEMFGRAIGWYEDHAFLRGNGVGKPFGVLSFLVPRLRLETHVRKALPRRPGPQLGGPACCSPARQSLATCVPGQSVGMRSTFMNCQGPPVEAGVTCTPGGPGDS